MAWVPHTLVGPPLLGAGGGCPGTGPLWWQGRVGSAAGLPAPRLSRRFPAVLLAQNLNSDDQDVVLRALKRVPEGRLKKEGLKALSLLLVEGNSKVVSAVSAQLRSLAENPRFRQRVRARQGGDVAGWRSPGCWPSALPGQRY